MSNFQAILEAYGADYAKTMERFMGNEAFYMRMLMMLSRDENLQLLGTALENGDLTAAFEAAHTLKGVAGNLGLTPLYDAVCKIVEPLRKREDGCDYSARYRTIQDEFRKAEQLRQNLAEEM